MMRYLLVSFGKRTVFCLEIFDEIFRVSPETKLQSLRETIEMICGKEDNFPREFIFLRSVGRCLTRVKQKQENELKVKNYRPPQVC
jgi:hypothetical protein